MALVLGVTGGIGAGKSTVLRMLARLGAETVDADDIARDVLARDTPAYGDVVQRFGRQILTADREIDRSALGSIVFRDPDARKALEDITHPRIIARIRSLIDRFRDNPPSCEAVLALEIPLLLECGLEHVVDQVMVVAAEQETQLDRLTSRSIASREEALRRIDAQMPLAHKIERADKVIWNDGTLQALEGSVRAAWDEILLL